VTASVSRDPRARWLRPRVALPVIAGAVVVVALLTPESTGGRTGDARLSSRSTQPQGAAVLYELADRLGWRTSQRLTDSIPSDDTTSVHVILDPPLALTSTETGQLLDRVRRGAGLVYVLGGDGPIADSLGFGSRRDRPGSIFGTALELGGSGRLVASDTTSCAERGDGFLAGGLPFWPDGETLILAIRWQGAAPEGSEVLASVRTFSRGSEGETSPAAVGFPLGRGRVAVVADPDLLRNDVLRVCRWGADVAAVRILEYASGAEGEGGRRQQLVFDEYHQGYGEHPGTFRGIFRYLGRTPSGHLVLQLAGAGLVLLLAVGPRLLVPRGSDRIERRSPLEHVEALAQAYRAVGATRTATSRLVHGVRRRVEHALGARSGAASDDDFLGWAEQRVPERAADVAVVRQALAQPLPRRELEAVGHALRRIEVALTSFPRTS
jgi:hypothetical protein